MRRQRSSRLKRTSEHQNKKQALIFGIATVVVVFLVVQFGPILINVFGNVVYTLRGGDAQSGNPVNGSELIQAPTLFGVTNATQSAEISFSGIAPDTKGLVEIYVNDRLEDEIDLNNTTNFEVKIDLRKGRNTIKARYIQGNQTSPFSESYAVNYTTEKPELEITSPKNGDSFTKADKSINVTGKTNPDNVISVNSFRAIVDSEGNFSYLLQLNDGENTIIIEATNPAGVRTQESINVSYQP